MFSHAYLYVRVLIEIIIDFDVMIAGEINSSTFNHFMDFEECRRCEGEDMICYIMLSSVIIVEISHKK